MPVCVRRLRCLVCVFPCTVLFVSISQVIGCEDHQNDLDCVEWDVKLCCRTMTDDSDVCCVCVSQPWSGDEAAAGWRHECIYCRCRTSLLAVITEAAAGHRVSSQQHWQTWQKVRQCKPHSACFCWSHLCLRLDSFDGFKWFLKTILFHPLLLVWPAH